MLDSEISDILAECYKSTKKFAEVFFPDRFFRKFSAIHDDIFALLDDPKLHKVVIEAPRGIGKTSILNMVLPAKRMLYRDANYIVPISESQIKAMEQSENLKLELTGNELLKKCFGAVKSKNWSKETWDSTTGTRVMPRGSGQQIRGSLYRNRRPDLIIMDDLEGRESVASEVRTKSTIDYVTTDVCNSVDRGLDNWYIYMVGTPLHERSALEACKKDKSWTHITLGICDEDFKSRYPELIDDAGIQRLIEEHRDKGALDQFYQEYMCKMIATENATFRQDMFKYYEEKDIKDRLRRRIETFVIVDPAKTVTPNSAYTAIVGVGFDTETNAIYVRDVVNERLHPDQVIQKTFEMATRLGARVIGIEVTSLNEFITYPVRNEILRRGMCFELIELKARAKKEDRVKALIPFYRQGLVYHNKGLCNVLEGQLLSFPRSEYWDVMDATAYIVEMLEIGERYMSTQGPDDIEKEYEDFYKEDQEESKLAWNHLA